MKRWLAAATVVLASACAAAPEQSPVAAPLSPTSTAAPSSEAAPVAALDFTAATVDGGQLDGGDLTGRDVVLWFWAPW